MLVKKTVVILYEEQKNGNIAESLQVQLQSTYPDHYVVLISDAKYLRTDLSKLNRSFRNFYTKNIPQLEMFFSKLENIRTAQKIRSLRRRVKKQIPQTEASKVEKMLNGGLKHIQNILFRFSPDMVICLSPECLKMTLDTKRLMGIELNVVAFVPELVLDNRFVSLEATGYYVLTAEVRAKLLKYGISEDRIIVNGFPPCIASRATQATGRTKLGIDNDLPVVLLTAGELGKAKLFDAFRVLLEDADRFNLVVDLGSGQTKKYEKAAVLCSARDHVILRTNEPTRALIETADLVITTPHIDRMYPAFWLNIPVISIKPMNLMEQRTTEYLEKHSLAIPVDMPEKLPDIVANSVVPQSLLTQTDLAFQTVTNKLLN